MEQQGPTGLVDANAEAEGDGPEHRTEQGSRHDQADQRLMMDVRHVMGFDGRAGQDGDGGTGAGHGGGDEEQRHVVDAGHGSEERTDRGSRQLCGEDAGDRPATPLDRHIRGDEGQAGHLHRSGGTTLDESQGDEPPGRDREDEGEARSRVEDESADQDRTPPDAIRQSSGRELREQAGEEERAHREADERGRGPVVLQEQREQRDDRPSAQPLEEHHQREAADHDVGGLLVWAIERLDRRCGLTLGHT